MKGTTSGNIAVICAGLVFASLLGACAAVSTGLPASVPATVPTPQIVVVTAQPEVQAPIVITATPGPTQTPIVVVVTATPEPVELTTIPTEAPAMVVPTDVLPPTTVATEVPAVPDGLAAIVFNGGNVRGQPHIRGAVLDQINAGEYVRLQERSADNAWYRITNARGVSGWVNVSLLTIAPEVAAQVTSPEYRTMDVRELVKNPRGHLGTSIKMTGTVFNIDEDDKSTYIQMWVQKPGGSEWDTEAVIVLVDGSLAGVYEDTIITVYGLCAGSQTIVNAYGAEIEQPIIMARYVMY